MSLCTTCRAAVPHLEVGVLPAGHLVEVHICTAAQAAGATTHGDVAPSRRDRALGGCRGGGSGCPLQAFAAGAMHHLCCQLACRPAGPRQREPSDCAPPPAQSAQREGRHRGGSARRLRHAAHLEGGVQAAGLLPVRYEGQNGIGLDAGIGLRARQPVDDGADGRLRGAPCPAPPPPLVTNTVQERA